MWSKQDSLTVLLLQYIIIFAIVILHPRSGVSSIILPFEKGTIRNSGFGVRNSVLGNSAKWIWWKSVSQKGENFLIPIKKKVFDFLKLQEIQVQDFIFLRTFISSYPDQGKLSQWKGCPYESLNFARSMKRQIFSKCVIVKLYVIVESFLLRLLLFFYVSGINLWPLFVHFRLQYFSMI